MPCIHSLLPLPILLAQSSTASPNTTLVHRTGQHSEMSSEGAHTGAVRFLCLSPDGEHMLTGSDDKTAKLWSLSTKKCLATWWVSELLAHAVGCKLPAQSWRTSIHTQPALRPS